MTSAARGAFHLGPLRVVAAPADRPPFAVDALVVEDDTYGVLGADPEFREPTEHPLRILTAVHEMVPARPGTIRLAPGDPPRLLAVVHDLSLDPTWKEEWVAQALDGALLESERRGLRSLGLPVLGAVHGRMPAEKFLDTLVDALARRPASTLERAWLVPPPRLVAELEHLLEQLAADDRTGPP